MCDNGLSLGAELSAPDTFPAELHVQLGRCVFRMCTAMGLIETNLVAGSRASGGLSVDPKIAKLFDRGGRVVKYAGYIYALYSVIEVAQNDKLSGTQKVLLITHNAASKADPTGTLGWIPVRAIVDRINANDNEGLATAITELKDRIAKLSEIVTVFRDP